MTTMLSVHLRLLSPFRLVLLLIVLCLWLPQTTANCDVYKRTMDSIDFWHTYDFSQGMAAAIEELYAPGAKVTSSISSGTVTLPPDQFFGAFHHLSIAKLKIDVRDIDCAADGAWCHLKVMATYWSSHVGETVSTPQHWTYFYDLVTCKLAHYVILQHSNDLEYMVDVLTPSIDEEEEDENSNDGEGDEL